MCASTNLYNACFNWLITGVSLFWFAEKLGLGHTPFFLAQEKKQNLET